MNIPKGHSAVMAMRRDPIDALDFFPTPPWASRALCHIVLKRMCDLGQLRCWEPAAGEGHMAEVLREYFSDVYASDVFDYGRGYGVGSFVGDGADVAQCPFHPDWIITNPPFNLALEFVAKAIEAARFGVAVLVRTAWLEGKGRYEDLFSGMPPAEIALFSERVPMVKGRWDPNGSTATSYAWVIWRIPPMNTETRLTWIPPGSRRRFEHADDRARFAAEVPA